MRWMKGYRKGQFQASDQQKEELMCTLAPDSVLPLMPSIHSTNALLETDFTYEELEKCFKKKRHSPRPRPNNVLDDI